MGTRFVRTNLNLGNIATTKLLVISTDELTLTIGSGNVAIEATNLGPQTVLYGDSAVRINSGGLIVGNGSKFWDSVHGSFIMRFATTVGSSQLIVHEYAGN